MDDVIDFVVFVLSLAAIGIGVGCELSPGWAAIVVGGILASAVVAERMTQRLVGAKKEKA